MFLFSFNDIKLKRTKENRKHIAQSDTETSQLSIH